MKRKVLTTILVIFLFISCGQAEKEAEIKRIHLEQVQVGKSLIRTELNNSIDVLKKALSESKRELVEIKKFQIGRYRSTREKQIREQKKVISQIETKISKVEKEISFLHLNQTFPFQDSPIQLVQHLFTAAQIEDFNSFRFLCDPYGTSDSNALQTCMIFIFMNEDTFIRDYKMGRIIGEPIISNDQAIVEIAFGASANRLKKIHLVKRMNKWYIKSL